MAGNAAAQGAQGFKGQPWVLYDTVAAWSFLAGDSSDDGLAKGSRNPAVSAKGELAFFQERSRSAVGEAYTNLDQPGQLSYGMEVWGIYFAVMLPITATFATDDGTGNSVYHQMAKLAECLLNGAALLVDLGQEEQTAFHALRFGAGGGLQIQGSNTILNVNNGEPFRQHMMVFPEPIEMPRTQNFVATLELSPEALDLIGTVATPGVGIPLPAISFVTTPFGEGTATTVTKRELPYMAQLGFVGRRVKKTQYGQLGPRPQRRK